ncbi:MAG: prolyl oligopeptidase family serine peptidase [Gammaproteobacteria bacterium]|nr:prolyl oligopeptidase family serine peptidase [Gammaproteobacteria bacterium]
MITIKRLIPLALLIMLVTNYSTAQAGSICNPDKQQASGSIYRICMPATTPYNGDLVIWAHGFQDAGMAVQIPEDQIVINGVALNDIINGMGFGFATNSYSKTGLAVRQGMDDILDLINLYTAEQGAPNRIYLTGASEGGLITTLLLEAHPDIFAGGLATCGPVGSFPYQINYLGDARATFEVFFPGLIPGDVFNPSQSLIDGWSLYYEQVVMPVVFDPLNRNKLDQWVKVAKLPYDATDYLNTVEISVRDVLRYNVVNTLDATATLGGFPFSNRSRWYRGSSNDIWLNLAVPRADAEPVALDEMKTRYNTSGQLLSPLVTMHTSGDQQVPYLHQTLYSLKTLQSGALFNQHVPLRIERFEHCNFKISEVLAGFSLLLKKTVGLENVPAVTYMLPVSQQAEYEALAASYGLMSVAE